MNLVATRYKINAHTSLKFLYINNERSEREIKEAMSFIKEVKAGVRNGKPLQYS